MSREWNARAGKSVADWRRDHEQAAHGDQDARITAAVVHVLDRRARSASSALVERRTGVVSSNRNSADQERAREDFKNKNRSVMLRSRSAETRVQIRLEEYRHPRRF